MYLQREKYYVGQLLKFNVIVKNFDGIKMTQSCGKVNKMKLKNSSLDERTDFFYVLIRLKGPNLYGVNAVNIIN